MGVIINAILINSRPTKFDLPTLTKKHSSAITSYSKIAQIFGKGRVEMTAKPTATFSKNLFLSNPLSSVYNEEHVFSNLLPPAACKITLSCFLSLYYVD